MLFAEQEQNQTLEEGLIVHNLPPYGVLTLLLLGKARKRSLLSLNRKVLNCFQLRGRLECTTGGNAD